MMPIGEFVKPQPRGQVTIPKKVRNKVGLKKNTVLNVFEENGVIVMVPVKPVPAMKFQLDSDLKWEKAAEKTKRLMKKYTDWTTPNFSVDKYMEAVRYNPLAKLRMKRLRDQW